VNKYFRAVIKRNQNQCLRLSNDIEDEARKGEGNGIDSAQPRYLLIRRERCRLQSLPVCNCLYSRYLSLF
jgi:hypothetical protein